MCCCSFIWSKIIEKHITIKNSLKVPDQKVSCDPSQFKILVKKIRYIEKITGDENSFPCQAEIKRRENYHRSIISVKNILKDEFFNKNNIALKRSREKIKGLHPKFFFKILGKKAKKILVKILGSQEIIIRFLSNDKIINNILWRNINTNFDKIFKKRPSTRKNLYCWN